MVSHFDNRELISVPAGLIDFLDEGRTAVALFFVLSGFILAYNYMDLSGSAGRTRFYASRLARIYPVTLLALGLGAAGVTYAVANRDSGVLWAWYLLDDASPVILIVSFLAQATMTTAWFPVLAVMGLWNGAAWSIACEVFFYALFPFLIGKMRELSMRQLRVLLLVTWAMPVLILATVGAFRSERSGHLARVLFPGDLPVWVSGGNSDGYCLPAGRPGVVVRWRAAEHAPCRRSCFTGFAGIRPASATGTLPHEPALRPAHPGAGGTTGRPPQFPRLGAPRTAGGSQLCALHDPHAPDESLQHRQSAGRRGLAAHGRHCGTEHRSLPVVRNSCAALDARSYPPASARPAQWGTAKSR